MGYGLGVDLGTTNSAAAIRRGAGATMAVDMVALSHRATVVPSAVFLSADGEFLVGEAALRRGLTEPERLVREFKRRIGDSVPLMVGGSPLSAEAVSARLLRWVVDQVSQQEGEPPEEVALTHPANWGPFKQDRLSQVIRLAELGCPVKTLTEPEAAAIAYAAAERVPTGEVVAVFDLGGGTFDAAVLRKLADGTGFEMLGQPEGIEHLGGVDIDEAVFAHVQGSLGDLLDDVPIDDPVTSRAMARVRQDCVDAKEALSSDSDVSIPVVLPQLSTEVRLTRSELELKVRPLLEDTVGALRRAIASTGLAPAEVDRILLVGGSSRMPLIAQLVSETLGRPYSIDAHPKHVVALGAARFTAPATPDVVEPAVPLPEPSPPTAPGPVVGPVFEPVGPPGDHGGSKTLPNGAWRRRRRRQFGAVGALVVALGGLAIAAWVLSDGSGGGERPRLTGPSVTLAGTIPVGPGPDGMTVDPDGTVWVTSKFAANEGQPDLTRIDPATGTAEPAYTVGGEPIGILAAADSLWVARTATDQVARIDPATGEETATIPAAGTPHDLAFGGGMVWVAGADGTLTRIDPADNSATELRTDLAGPDTDLSAVAADDDRVWVAYGANPGTVAALDPDTGDTIDEVTIEGDVDELALSGSGLWVARRDGNTVHRIDPDSLDVLDVQVGAAPAGVAADGDHIWVTNNGAASLTLIDGPSGRVLSSITVGDKPLGLAVTPGRVWVSLSAADTVAEVDVGGDESA